MLKPRLGDHHQCGGVFDASFVSCGNEYIVCSKCGEIWNITDGLTTKPTDQAALQAARTPFAELSKASPDILGYVAMLCKKLRANDEYLIKMAEAIDFVRYVYDYSNDHHIVVKAEKLLSGIDGKDENQ